MKEIKQGNNVPATNTKLAHTFSNQLKGYCLYKIRSVTSSSKYAEPILKCSFHKCKILKNVNDGWGGGVQWKLLMHANLFTCMAKITN